MAAICTPADAARLLEPVRASRSATLAGGTITTGVSREPRPTGRDGGGHGARGVRADLYEPAARTRTSGTTLGTAVWHRHPTAGGGGTRDCHLQRFYWPCSLRVSARRR